MKPRVTLKLDLNRVVSPVDWSENELTIEGKSTFYDQTIMYVVEPAKPVMVVLLPKGTKAVLSGQEDFG